MDTLKDVAKSPNATELVLVFIIIVIALVAFGIPIYKLISKSAKEKREYWFQREQLLVDVVKENTEANTELVSVLRNMNTNCVDCRKEQNEKLKYQSDKLDSIVNIVEKTKTIVDERLERRTINTQIETERRS